MKRNLKEKKFGKNEKKDSINTNSNKYIKKKIKNSLIMKKKKDMIQIIKFKFFFNN